MPTETSAEILPAELSQIVVSVFDTMVGLHAVECDQASTRREADAEPRISSAVHLMGNWEGVVVLECTVRQARNFSARYICMGDPDRRTDAETAEAFEPERRETGEEYEVMRDVVGELANMIGGNVKSVLDRGLKLSIPVVVEGDYIRRVTGHQIRERLPFECTGGVFWVTVLRPCA